MNFPSLVVLKETLLYREVLFNLVLQDLKIKYQRTYMGYLWSLLNPLFQLAVLSVIFSQITRVEMESYALYLFAGLLPWGFFNQSVSLCSRSFLDNENFIKKIYLPKSIFPLSKVMLKAVDFLFSLIALTLLGSLVGFPFHATVLLTPLALFPLFFFSLGLGILSSVVTVYIRDWEYIQNVLLNLLYFATPILYPLSLMPVHYQSFLKLNPVYCQLHLFQVLLYEGRLPTPTEWLVAWAVGGVTFLFGLFILARKQNDLVYQL